ncbi:uncharacterized protein ACB058_006453 [Synchiropus picturatus]
MASLRKEALVEIAVGSDDTRMSSVQTLRQYVNDRLAAAAREIFQVFELTVSGLEEEVDRQRKQLDGLLKPAVLLQMRDVQQLANTEEFHPEQHEWSSSVQQNGPVAVPATEEEFNFVIVKIGDDGVVTQPLNLPQAEIEEPASSISTQHLMARSDEVATAAAPEILTTVRQVPEEERSLSSESDTDDSSHWRETSDTTVTSKRHLYKKSGDSDDTSLTCPVCGRICTSKSGLSMHKRMCTGEVTFTCSFCRKSFNKRSVLKKHMKIHTGERPFFCTVCSKRFIERGKLKVHMRIHTGEKPYSCSVCGKRFIERSNLKIHMRIHTGEKPYSCSVCGKCFNQCTLLKTHMISHTGEKPFRCSECGKSFTGRGTLNVHMRTHTRNKPFSCSKCGKNFPDKGYLRKHMLSHDQGEDRN